MFTTEIVIFLIDLIYIYKIRTMTLLICQLTELSWSNSQSFQASIWGKNRALECIIWSLNLATDGDCLNPRRCLVCWSGTALSEGAESAQPFLMHVFMEQTLQAEKCCDALIDRFTFLKESGFPYTQSLIPLITVYLKPCLAKSICRYTIIGNRLLQL